MHQEQLSTAAQIAAVKRNGCNIRDFPNAGEAVQMAAIAQAPDAIEHIENPSERIQLAAVQRAGWVIQYIEHPSEAVQLAAVADVFALRSIPNPSEAVQLATLTAWKPTWPGDLPRSLRSFYKTLAYIKSPAVLMAFETVTRALDVQPGTPGFSAAVQAAYDGLTGKQ